MATSVNRVLRKYSGLAKRELAFTLLELLLSMLLTSLLLVTLSAGMGAVVNDWQRETSSLDIQLDDSLALLQLERALLAAFPHSYVDRSSLVPAIYFEGFIDELSWVSTISPQRQTGLTAWKLNSDRIGGLQLSITPAFSDNPEERLNSAIPTTLLKNYHAEFHYLNQVNSEEKAWLEEWFGAERQSLPIAVHIIFTPLVRENDRIFEITVPIKNYRHENIQPVNFEI